MATIENTIKKGIKITGNQPVKKGNFYFFSYKGYDVSFAQNGSSGDSTNFYTKRKGLEDDHMTDYFAGTFHDNISQCFRFIDQSNPNPLSK